MQSTVDAIRIKRRIKSSKKITFINFYYNAFFLISDHVRGTSFRRTALWDQLLEVWK